MKNSNRGFIVPLLLIIIAVLLVGGGAYVYQNSQSTPPTSPTATTTTQTTTTTVKYTLPPTTALASHCGMTINSPAMNATVSFPLAIGGVIDNRNYVKAGCSWALFEGEAGPAQLYFQAPGTSVWNKIGAPVIVPASNWMSEDPVPFSVTMNFNNDGVGLPGGTKMKIVFTDNQQKDNSTASTLELPITLSDSTSSFKLYFSNDKLKPVNLCTEVEAVTRTVSKTGGVAVAAVNELLKGPTSEERSAGYSSSIPVGSKLNSLTIVGGEARADFSATTESGGGSCSMAMRVAQIRKTLLQFPTIKSVKISINGKTQDIFQP